MIDQATFEQLLAGVHDQLGAIGDLSVTAGDADRPLVVLVHGIGGSAQHWSNPIALDVNQTWLYDTVAKPEPPQGVSGVLTSPAYAPDQVRPWCQVLAEQHMTAINFSQSQPSGPLAVAADELQQVLLAVESELYARAGRPDHEPPLVLLCHSRGGLVARQVLKRLGSEGLPHLSKVITLCTPHAGSYLPALARDYDNLTAGKLDLGQLPATVGPLARLLSSALDDSLRQAEALLGNTLKHTFGAQAFGEGFDELLPSSTMLEQLADGEAPLAGVEYHGVGGSTPAVIELYLAEAGHVLPLLTVSSAALIELFDRCVPALRSDFGGLAELDQGDSAVSLLSSHWPEAFTATYASLAFNHMQALIDGSLQGAVVELLTS